jgi:hypothetical protein
MNAALRGTVFKIFTILTIGPTSILTVIHQGRFQHRFSINVWAGIIGTHLIGPFLLPARLTGENYLNFLNVDLPGLLEEIPLEIRRAMWFMHDGAPAHFTLNVRHFLNVSYGPQWIGRGGPTAWPPRSPDLNRCDFYLWGYIIIIIIIIIVDG